MKQHRLSTQQKLDVVALYAAGRGAPEIARQFGISPAAVRGLLVRRGIKLRSNADSHVRYKCDRHFFDVIDSETKAYWLGFLMADGAIFDGAVMLGLHSKDISHLSKFRDAVAGNQPIKSLHKYGQEVHRITINSRSLAAGLARHGCTERKSHSACPPVLPSDLERHFWRGVIEGDGCITTNGNGPCVSLVGSKLMCDGFSDFLRREAGCDCTTLPHKTIFIVKVTRGAAVVQILSLLYNGATVFLDRKKVLADRWEGWQPTSHVQRGLNSRKLSPEEESYIVESTLSQRELAHKFGISKSGVGLIRQRNENSAANIRLKGLAMAGAGAFNHPNAEAKTTVGNRGCFHLQSASL